MYLRHLHTSEKWTIEKSLAMCAQWYHKPNRLPSNMARVHFFFVAVRSINEIV